MKTVIKKALFTLCVLISCASVFAKDDGTMYVKIQNASVKQKASAMAGEAGVLEYGSKVTVINSDGGKAKKGWVFVRSADKKLEGYLPEKCLTAKKISAYAASTSFNTEEIALAGKGFSSALEDVYKKEFGGNFDDVEFIEEQNVEPKELIEFIEEGKLEKGEYDEE